MNVLAIFGEEQSAKTFSFRVVLGVSLFHTSNMQESYSVLARILEDSKILHGACDKITGNISLDLDKVKSALRNDHM